MDIRTRYLIWNSIPKEKNFSLFDVRKAISLNDRVKFKITLLQIRDLVEELVKKGRVCKVGDFFIHSRSR